MLRPAFLPSVTIKTRKECTECKSIIWALSNPNICYSCPVVGNATATASATATPTPTPTPTGILPTIIATATAASTTTTTVPVGGVIDNGHFRHLHAYLCSMRCLALHKVRKEHTELTTCTCKTCKQNNLKLSDWLLNGSNNLVNHTNWGEMCKPVYYLDPHCYCCGKIPRIQDSKTAITLTSRTVETFLDRKKDAFCFVQGHASKYDASIAGTLGTATLFLTWCGKDSKCPDPLAYSPADFLANGKVLMNGCHNLNLRHILLQSKMADEYNLFDMLTTHPVLLQPSSVATVTSTNISTTEVKSTPSTQFVDARISLHINPRLSRLDLEKLLTHAVEYYNSYQPFHKVKLLLTAAISLRNYASDFIFNSKTRSQSISSDTGFTVFIDVNGIDSNVVKLLDSISYSEWMLNATKMTIV